MLSAAQASTCCTVASAAKLRSYRLRCFGSLKISHAAAISVKSSAGVLEVLLSLSSESFWCRTASGCDWRAKVTYCRLSCDRVMSGVACNTS